MTSYIDLAISFGIFVLFVVLVISQVSNYIKSYTGMATTNELRGIAVNIFNSLFSGKGLPSNWEEKNFTPVQIGLISDLYEIPLVVNETNGTNRVNISINATVNFDTLCENKSWEYTVVLYDENNNQVPLTLYNQSYCNSHYLNHSDIVFNLTLNAYQSKTFFLYFSPDRTINATHFSLPYPNETNYTVTIYPQVKLETISVEKLLALRRLIYNNVKQTLGVNYNFYLEISK